MEIRITTEQILKILNVISWIIFIGLCVEAGSYVFNAVFTVAFKPQAADYFGLSSLYAYDTGYFLVLLLMMFIVATLKTLMFYLIVKIVHHKKLDFSQPFNKEIRRFILNVSYLAFGISMFTAWGVKHAEWLTGKGIEMPEIHNLHFDGADVWLFMSIILLVIAQIFKRGIEIQSENELTI